MSEFVFNLNGMPVGQLQSIGSKLNTGLSANTPDSQLTYSGNDYIVWDRVNSERLRRGLPGLAEIGSPRPPEDTLFAGGTSPASTAPSADTETYKIKGPPGMTLEQAQAIFKQQTNTGALAGFKVGDVLSAATQAADGLTAAAPQLSQGLASATSLLPSGINTASITSALGPNGSAVAGQITSALQGAGPAVASSLATGASNFNSFAGGITSQLSSGIGSFQSALPGAISTAQANLPGELAKMQSALPGAIAGITSTTSALSGALTGQAAQVGSLANNAIKTLTSGLSGTPLNGIDIAGFTKQLPALGDIGNLSKVDVTGTLAQASKMIGQGFDKISNELGAGKFGFDATQLEKAGMVKPGTAAAFLQGGADDLVSVLKSPTVWTGKDGIKSLDGLLKNNNLQDKIQQGLMSSGLADIKQMGIPTDKLNPAALSGLATNAAKSVGATMAWATNSPNIPQIPTIPGGDVKAAFDKMTTNGAFAVKFSNEKVEPALKQEEPVVPATETVNTATVDAASKRVIGNEKVPEPNASAGTGEFAAVYEFMRFVNNTTASFVALAQKINAINARYQAITQAQWNIINDEAVAIRATARARIDELRDAAFKSLPDVGRTYAQKNAINQFNYTVDDAKAMIDLSQSIRAMIKDLANKIYAYQVVRADNSGAGG